MCSTPIKQGLAFACTLILAASPLRANCSIERYADLSSLAGLEGVIQFDDLEFQSRLEAYRDNKRLNRIDRNVPPVSVKLSSSLEGSGSESSHFSELRTNYDINFIAQLKKRQLSKKSDGVLTIREAATLNERRLFFLEKMLLISFSKKQLEIYEGRLQNYFSLKKFLQIKITQGEYLSQELSKVNLDILELNNRILAVRTRFEVVKNELGVEIGWDVVEEAAADLEWTPEFSPLICDQVSTETLLADANVRIARIRKNVNLIEDTFSLNVYGAHTLERWEDDNPTYGVAMEIDLFAPKSRGKSKRQGRVDIDQAMRDLHLGTSRVVKLLREQESVEELISSSIKAIDAEISSRRRQLRELSARGELGQSIFQERNSVELELSSLQEVRLQRVYDLYNGWIQFLKAKGLGEAPGE